MNVSYINREAMRRVAAMRPSGYEADVLSSAMEVTDTHVVLPRSEYLRLLAKYRVGPGTELKALLKKIGITASPGCSCNKRAKTMDDMGCDWCEANIDTIDGWLAEEANKRKLPYLSMAGKTLIRLAIRRARKKGNNH